jgi:prepilin-type N-terminal cleavage/methylation domain-containing protein
MLTKLGNRDGMTLAEILVAVAIIGIGLVALAAVIPLASYGMQEGSQLSTATFLANQRLEQVRNASWTLSPANDCIGISASSTTAPNSASCNGAAVTTFSDESPLAFPYGGYTRAVRVADCNVGGGCSGITNPGLRQITVTVSYSPLTGVGQAATGTTKSAVLTMYIAQR